MTLTYTATITKWDGETVTYGPYPSPDIALSQLATHRNLTVEDITNLRNAFSSRASYTQSVTIPIPPLSMFPLSWGKGKVPFAYLSLTVNVPALYPTGNP